MAPMAEYNDKLDIVTREVVICKLLTSNDTKVRKRGLKSLKKWFGEIGLKKGVEENDFNRIWNGLFYYVWMSDKPLVQEEAVECISGMMHNIENYQASMFYIRGFFSSLARQWDRISHYRIDKFLMFIRRFLRHILMMLKKYEWDIEKLELFSKELYNAVQVLPYSLALHLNDIFNEEVAKVSNGEVSTDALVVLYKGYIECIANLRPSMQIINSIQTNIFSGLVRQLKLFIKQKALSDCCDNEDSAEYLSSGIKKTSKSDIDSRHEDLNENCDNEDSENEEIALDPRPGGVDVILPCIEFDEKLFVKFIEQYTSKSGLPIKAKNILNQIVPMFASISKLRATKPEEFIHEMKQNPKKKKRQKAMSKLIKKSCNRLEEDDEMEAERDERVLQKLRNMTDLIQIPAGKSTFTVVQMKPKTKPTKRSSISNDWVVTDSNKLSPPKKAKISGGKSDWIVESTPKDEQKSAPVIEQSESINKDEADDADICLEIVDENKSSPDRASTEEISNMHEDEGISKIHENESQKNENVHIEKEVSTKETIVEAASEKSENKSPKKSLTVSFSEEPSLKYYENDSEEPTRDSNPKSEIIIPASVIKDRPKLMKKEGNYVVVDFKPESETITDKKIDPKPSQENIHSPEPEKVTRTLRSRNVEIGTAPVSTPDVKRTRKPREKKVVPAVQRKSCRIAEKQKKVLFKLEDNTYQDISAYAKVLVSKPALPFDVSKLPKSGILKPFAVTSPINPFYFANGERKLKRKRKSK